MTVMEKLVRPVLLAIGFLALAAGIAGIFLPLDSLCEAI